MKSTLLAGSLARVYSRKLLGFMNSSHDLSLPILPGQMDLREIEAISCIPPIWRFAKGGAARVSRAIRCLRRAELNTFTKFQSRDHCANMQDSAWV